MRAKLNAVLAAATLLAACGSSTTSNSTSTGGAAGAGGSSGAAGSGGSAGVPSGGQWVWQSRIASSNQLNTVWSSAPNDVWAAGDGGTLVHWDGSKWSTVPSGTANHLHGIWGASAKDLWAVAGGLGGPGTSNLVHFDGSTWSPADSGTPDNLNGIWGSGPKDVWAVGASGVEGVIVHYDGNAWSIATKNAVNQLRAITGNGASDLWAVGSLFYPGNAGDQSILHYVGGQWTAVSSGAPGKELLSVWSASASDAWAVGDAAVLHWDGKAWAPLTDPLVAGPFDGVWGTDATHISVVGPKAAILEWDGKQWASRMSGGAGLMAVGGSNQDDRWAVGENGTIFRYQAGSTGTLGCSDIGGSCVGVSACAQGLGHLTDYACGGGASTVCCVSNNACGTSEVECCSPSGAKSRPTCHNGAFVCPSGSTTCQLPP